MSSTYYRHGGLAYKRVGPRSLPYHSTPRRHSAAPLVQRAASRVVLGVRQLLDARAVRAVAHAGVACANDRNDRDEWKERDACDAVALGGAQMQ